ncbi:MAG: hypothetical protein A3F89_07895 [Deltaproteobacteria bacterium RIFCSPLOWO2_12_FULL_50_11]|nr:MAG: hypothetical protein A3F89_07895 [Deltaproteobacteria bacterium RIFCSPLOWO2_12_FULL_50_11]
MENLPKIIDETQWPLEIKIHDPLRDHTFQGRIVLPAVETMQLLAHATKSRVPDIHTSLIRDIRFTKFLFMDADTKAVDAVHEVRVFDDGTVRSRLLTTFKSKKNSITRPQEHAQLLWTRNPETTPLPPYDSLLGLEGIGLEVPAQKIYQDLVPFGPAYQNITSPLLMTGEGGLCSVSGGIDTLPAGPLGSPFPLDASFHAASVWGQHFMGLLTFPVAIKKRLILQPTVSGKTYLCKTIFVKKESDSLFFDIWILGPDGNICEGALGVQMKKVAPLDSQPQPPMPQEGKKDLEWIRKKCRDLALIELKTIEESAKRILSPDERERLQDMTRERGASYLAARLALKRLSRRMSGNDTTTPADTIVTVTPDKQPRCPLTNGEEGPYCSLSHDKRFAVAVVSDNKIGIDVEEISDRVLKPRRFYMNEKETLLAKNSSLNEVEAFLRVWSIKEAASKATGLKLATVWSKTSVTEIGREKSVVEIDGTLWEVFHEKVDNHLFTILTLQNP